MTIAFVAYRWNYIAPGATVGVYMHGFAQEQFVAFDAIPFQANIPGMTPKTQLTVGPVQTHVDGSIARTTWVANQSISNGGRPTPGVNLSVLIEPLSR